MDSRFDYSQGDLFAPRPRPPPAAPPVAPATPAVKPLAAAPPPMSAPASDHRAWNEANRHVGVNCTVCDQRCKYDVRPLNKSLAVPLMAIVQHYAEHSDLGAAPFIRIAEFLNESGKNRANQAALLRHWGFIEPQPQPQPEERPGVKGPIPPKYRGMYRLTEAGRRFADPRSNERVHPIITYNQSLVGFALDREPVTIREALADEFEYAQIWAPSTSVESEA